MSEPTWEPDTVGERQLWLARASGDRDGFLRRLSRLELLLPLLPGELDDDTPATWAATVQAEREYVLAFTSATAGRQAVGGDSAYRPARFRELAATWPDPGVGLAVNPGLPIEVYLDHRVVLSLAALTAGPADDLEQELYAAAAAGEVDRYLGLLWTSRAFLPAPTGAQITDPAFVWCRAEGEPERIAVFTSPNRLRDQFGEHSFIEVSFTALTAAWPSPAAELVIDPGAAHSIALPGPSAWPPVN